LKDPVKLLLYNFSQETYNQSMNKIIFTKSGYENLIQEQDYLTEKRVSTLERLVRAREMGDLSENSAYRASRSELSGIDSRLRQIAYYIKCAEISNPKGDVADIGCRVFVNDGKNSFDYEIVGDYEADPVKRKVSVLSPIGNALLGKKVGDNITINIPSGKLNYKLKTIEKI